VISLSQLSRRALGVVLHALLVVCATAAAFWLRFDGEIPPASRQLAIDTVPLLVFLRLLVFLSFRLFDGLWRYTSLWDGRNIVAAAGASSLLFYGITAVLLPGTRYPLSILVIDTMILVCLMTGVRLAYRMYGELVQAPRGRTVLIYGAGDAGEMIVRDMRNRPEYDLKPVGFLDDDAAKMGRSIHGVPVLGTGADAERVIAAYAPDEVLIAVPSAPPETMRRIVRSLEHSKVRITTFPNLLHVVGRPVDVKQIRELRVEDLLARAPVGLDLEPVRRMVRGACVLVTGAGGSIGSEICRQVASLGPSQLVALDRYENSLVEVVNGIATTHPGVPVHAVIADVTDDRRIDDLFAEHRPAVVFHAAAHKHVPLMEGNACEAVKNNVRGSRVMAQAALRHRASQFVLISTDKAVNPVSVMGATKRIAELTVRELAGGGRAVNFVTVRFGNVLGSNGSVVPRFLEQIRRGGPVTVTHPDMTRYFMLIPEAVQLVLCAATLPAHGATYVLDMGEPVRLLEMAHDLIRLSGYIPEEEIPIEITGVRPGEKLHEALVGPGEAVEASPIPKILHVRPAGLTASDTAFLERVSALERAASAGDAVEVFALLRRLVPTFSPVTEPARA
jgi:FlaA1/EpsC-like NDP-sugar epimerase